MNQGLVPYRIMVTGSRGKSSVVRLLHTALNALGIDSYGRITGIVPRELGPRVNREIVRSSGAHVEEMRWWLKKLPGSTRGIVLENSAVSPELQHLAARWLKPNTIVLTNAIPDHQEVWGPTLECAENALVKGIPPRSDVVTPAETATNKSLMNKLVSRHCRVHFAEIPPALSLYPREKNKCLALGVLKVLGLDKPKAVRALQTLPPDRFDFQVLKKNDVNFAFAFTANDLNSTRDLYNSLFWNESETVLLFNHRLDRPERYKSFLSWLSSPRWRDVIVTGHQPTGWMKYATFQKVKSCSDLLSLFLPGEKVFGCGNVKGIPLDFGLI